MERPFAAYNGDEPYIFVSYAHEDAALVYRELTWLRDLGYNVWYDEGISPGSTWRQELAEALKRCSLFLLFVTPASARSDNCLKEVNYALDEGCPVLAIHLRETHLSEGLKLSLSDRQAILRYELADEEYAHKVTSGIGAMASLEAEVVSPPSRSRSYRSAVVAALLLGASFIAAVGYYAGGQGSGEVVIAEQPLPPAVDTAAKKPVESAIAVLPFVNMSDDREQEFFSDGLSEDLLNGLSQSSSMKVIARTSSFQFKGSTQDVREIGEALNVSHVLEGSVRKAGNRIRVTAQLVSTDDGTHLWSASYDRDLVDVFAVQDEIKESILVALDQHFAEPQVGVRVPTSNTAAYNAFLLGRHYSTRLQFDKSLAAYHEAVALDPEYSAALAGIAGIHTLMVWYFVDSMESQWPHIQEYMDRTLAIDPEDRDARRLRALNNFYIDRDFQKGIDEMHSLLRGNSNEVFDLAAYAVLMQTVGEWELAVEVWEHGLEVDPLSGFVHRSLGEAYMIAGRYEDAVASLRQAEELGVSSADVLQNVAIATRDEDLIQELLARPSESWGAQQPFRLVFEGQVAELKGDSKALEEQLAVIRASPYFESQNVQFMVRLFSEDVGATMAYWRSLIRGNEYSPFRAVLGSPNMRKTRPGLFDHPDYALLVSESGLDDVSLASLTIPPLPF